MTPRIIIGIAGKSSFLSVKQTTHCCNQYNHNAGLNNTIILLGIERTSHREETNDAPCYCGNAMQQEIKIF